MILKLLHLDVQDVPYVVLGQRVEHYDLIDPVQELRTDGHLQDFRHLLLAFIQKLAPPGYGLHLLGRIGTLTSD